MALELNEVRDPAARRRLERGEPVFLAKRRALLLPPASQPAGRRGGTTAGDTLAGLASPGSARRIHRREALRTGAVFLATRLLNPNRKCALLADLATGTPPAPGQLYLAAWARCLMDPRSNGRRTLMPSGAPIARRSAAWPGALERPGAIMSTMPTRRIVSI